MQIFHVWKSRKLTSRSEQFTFQTCGNIPKKSQKAYWKLYASIYKQWMGRVSPSPRPICDTSVANFKHYGREVARPPTALDPRHGACAASCGLGRRTFQHLQHLPRSDPRVSATYCVFEGMKISFSHRSFKRRVQLFPYESFLNKQAPCFGILFSEMVLSFDGGSSLSQYSPGHFWALLSSKH